MKRIFSFASGNIWRWSSSKNVNALLDYIRNLDISGVELTFATKENLYLFKLSKKNRAWINNLKHVTIHAPFKLFEYAENENEVHKQLGIIEKIYNEINAKSVVIHPESALLHSDIISKYDIKFSIENLNRKNNVTLSFLVKIFNKYPQADLCLDISHAYSWSKFETSRLIQAFKGKISQIHFSGYYFNKDHVSLRKVSKNFLFSIRPIKYFNVPIIIEEDIELRSLEYLKKELEYIKALF